MEGITKRGKRRGEKREEDLISKDNGISEFISDGTWITRTHAGSLPSICCCFYECTSGSIPSKVPCCSVGIHAGWVGFAVIHIHTYFTSCCIKINVNHVCSPYFFLLVFKNIFIPLLSPSYLLPPSISLFAFLPHTIHNFPFWYITCSQNRRTTFNRHNAQNVQQCVILLKFLRIK